jgi:hypothetical protein
LEAEKFALRRLLGERDIALLERDKAISSKVRMIGGNGLYSV